MILELEAEGRVGRAIINNDDILFLQSRIIKKKKSFWRGYSFLPPPPHYSSHDMAQKGVALLPPRSM